MPPVKIWILRGWRTWEVEPWWLKGKELLVSERPAGSGTPARQTASCVYYQWAHPFIHVFMTLSTNDFEYHVCLEIGSGAAVKRKIEFLTSGNSWSRVGGRASLTEALWVTRSRNPLKSFKKWRGALLWSPGGGLLGTQGRNTAGHRDLKALRNWGHVPCPPNHGMSPILAPSPSQAYPPPPSPDVLLLCSSCTWSGMALTHCHDLTTLFPTATWNISLKVWMHILNGGNGANFSSKGAIPQRQSPVEMAGVPVAWLLGVGCPLLVWTAQGRRRGWPPPCMYCHPFQKLRDGKKALMHVSHQGGNKKCSSAPWVAKRWHRQSTTGHDGKKHCFSLQELEETSQEME